MKISLITPAPPRSRKGNRITAVRWSRHFRDMGHSVHIEEKYHGRECDLMVGLHAKRSARSIKRFREDHPDRPLIVALTGTDLYKDIRTNADAQLSIDLADRLIVLQSMGLRELPERLREKVHVIVQSVKVPAGVFRPRKSAFEVCVVGHLRPVKDPFRAAEAARLLNASSKIEVLQMGGALSREMADRARDEAATNPRYRWIGEVPRWKALRLLSRSRLHVLSSEMEGGANVLCEAIACAIPTIASRISGSIGLLGEDYPGYFEVKDTDGLASMLERAEKDADFYRELKKWNERLKSIVKPSHERKCWEALLSSLTA
ncbi:MAG: selenoneine biosynthesis selenosugar synthase SenB [Nitrospinota bacterium]